MHPSRSPSVRSRRRSSQQRVSLIAGRVSIARIEPPSPPPMLAPSLHRTGSTSSFLSVAASAGPPTPAPERESYLGERSISEFSIEKEIGRGAYGLVKRAREIKPDGSLGVSKFVQYNFSLLKCEPAHNNHQTNHQISHTG
jgi:protein-serine/threonine kinase